jgi:hypothetical protein
MDQRNRPRGNRRRMIRSIPDRCCVSVAVRPNDAESESDTTSGTGSVTRHGGWGAAHAAPEQPAHRERRPCRAVVARSAESGWVEDGTGAADGPRGLEVANEVRRRRVTRSVGRGERTRLFLRLREHRCGRDGGQLAVATGAVRPLAGGLRREAAVIVSHGHRVPVLV